MDTGLLLDSIAFVFILLSLVYAVKNYFLIRVNRFLWLVFATLYGTILRGIHLARDFNLAVPSALITSRLFSLFYVFLFFGVLNYYLPLKRLLDELKTKS